MTKRYEYSNHVYFLTNLGDSWKFEAVKQPGSIQMGYRQTENKAREAAKKAIDAWSQYVTT